MTHADLSPALPPTVPHAPWHIRLVIAGKAAANRGPGAFAFVAVLQSDGGPDRALPVAVTPSRFDTTQMHATLHALRAGLLTIRQEQDAGRWPVCPVVVMSDVDYIVHGLSRDLPGWQASGWTLSDGRPLAHADLWRQIMELAEGMDLSAQRPGTQAQTDALATVKRHATAAVPARCQTRTNRQTRAA